MGLIEKNNTKENQKIVELYPNYLDTINPKYMVIDNMFVSSILITHYEKEMEGGFLEKILSLGIDMQIAIYYEKNNTKEVLKRITYEIGLNGADIKDSNENQLDRNIMNQKYEDAQYIRKQLQINDEKLFDLSMYMVVYATSLNKLEEQMNKLENVINMSGMERNKGIV